MKISSTDRNSIKPKVACQRLVFLPFLLLIGGFVIGCDEGSSIKLPFERNRSFHEKFNWKAENFFDDVKVAELCNAIEASDLQEIERLVKGGVDVNARGEGNMTPLLWALPDNKLERFTKLLELGADPNVRITTDLGVPSAFLPGQSVTLLSAKTHFPGFFQAVMKHGGDVGIRDADNDTVLHIIVRSGAPDRIERARLAIEHGADVNAQDNSMSTPAMDAVGFFGQYDLALLFLRAGADPDILYYDRVQKLVHFVVRDQRRSRPMSPQQKEDFRKLIDWLKQHGQDVEEADEDIRRWATFPGFDPPKYKAMMDKERALRAEREAQRREAIKAP